MLYVCLPVHNEAATAGVLLWRLRTVLQDTGRDYEVVVYDDASTDATAEVLAPYAEVLPLTVLGGPGAAPVGRSAATAALLRHVAAHARYPRRDACLVMQGDFSDRPEDVRAFLAAFDGGADLVVGRRPPDDAQPPAERRLRRLAPWVLRPLVRVDDVDDLLAGPRLLRGSVVRDLVHAAGDAPVFAWPGWAGQAELVVAAVPYARRVAVVDAPGGAGVRTRASRLDWAQELRGLARYAWQARGTRARAQSSPDAPKLLSAGDGGPHVAADAAARPERPRRTTPAAPPARGADSSAGVSAQPARPEPEAPAPATAVEQPRALGRARRARRQAELAAEAAADAEPAMARDDAPPIASRDVATLAEDGANPSRRRKRRRRTAGPRDATPVDDAPGDDAPAQDAPQDVAHDVAHAAARDGVPPDDAPQPDGPADAASEDGLAESGRRRRRRRGRGRSAGPAAGVVPSEDTAESPPHSAFVPDPHAAQPSSTPSSVQPAERQPTSE